MGWVLAATQDYAYLEADPRGNACVTLLSSGLWRWEASCPSVAAMFTMDDWWGVSDTREEAQRVAEAYLDRYNPQPEEEA